MIVLPPTVLYRWNVDRVSVQKNRRVPTRRREETIAGSHFSGARYFEGFDRGKNGRSCDIGRRRPPRGQATETEVEARRDPRSESTSGLSRLIPAYPNHFCPDRLLPGANYVTSTSRDNGVRVHSAGTETSSFLLLHANKFLESIHGVARAGPFFIFCPPAAGAC